MTRPVLAIAAALAALVALPAAADAAAPPRAVGTEFTAAGIGALHINLKPPAVRKLLGNPTTTSHHVAQDPDEPKGDGTLIVIYHYPRYGLEVVFTSDDVVADLTGGTPLVSSIRATHPRYRTPAGLHVGSTLSQLTQAEPKRRCFPVDDIGILGTTTCLVSGGDGGILFDLRQDRVTALLTQ